MYCVHSSLILDLDPALIGLSMAYAITLIGMFQHCIRTSAEVENLVRNYTLLYPSVWADQRKTASYNYRL